MDSGKFDLDAVCDLILKHVFLRVALQFPDEFLAHCVSIYTYIIKRLANDSIDVFLIGDSTYGSSIDDISGQHVDSDVLIYFGSDLSSSGSMPVMIVPFSKNVDMVSCIDELDRQSQLKGISQSAPKLLLYELSYHHAILESKSILQGMQNLMIADVPPSANLSNWDMKFLQSLPSSNIEIHTKVGGLLVPAKLLSDPNLVIWYIGGKSEQLININIRMSENFIVSYSPETKLSGVMKGCESREFRERYGGLLRVKDAQIIGIIVGSMGLSGEVTQAIVSRLETLIAVAKKSSYVFLMGRLNEAKLCNFPEIDIFCFISNEDVALIKPKTFHVPVVTPWELELGLGGREWQGIFRSDSASILSDVSVEDAVKNVIAALPEDNIDPDSDCDIGDMEDIQIAGSGKNLNAVATEVSDIRSAVEICQAGGGGSDTAASALTLLNSERSIIAFSSPAAEYFNEREFQGLLPLVPEGHDTAIQMGQYGIAKSYKKFDNSAPILDP